MPRFFPILADLFLAEKPCGAREPRILRVRREIVKMAPWKHAGCRAQAVLWQ
jgi:hypothetical protein